MATETQTIFPAHSAPVQKFSRYRSVRQAATKPQIPPFVTEGSSTSQNESVQRSMSRYRNRSFKPDPASSPPAPEQMAKPLRIPQSHSASLAALTGEPCSEDEEVPSPSPQKSAASRARHNSGPKNAMSPRKSTTAQTTPPARHAHPLKETPQPRQTSWEATCASRARAESLQSFTREEAREIEDAENERFRRLKAQQRSEREAKLEKRRAVAAEEKRRQESIEDEQQERHTAGYRFPESARWDVKPGQEQRQRGVGEGPIARAAAKKESLDLRRGNSTRQRLGSLSRKTSAELPCHDKIQQPPEKKDLSASRRPRGTIPNPRPRSDVPAGRPAPSNAILPTPWVDAPVSRPATQNDAPVVLPQYDAPVSAVNAGERHVLVQCNASSMTLPVTPSTTPQDLIDSASATMSEPIDPIRSRLVESFTQLGLERPLRNYEHVRDVMNSWDNDAQNTFLILPAGHDAQGDELDSKNVPKQQPGDTSVYMYHSQRPGTWDKRWITLRADGQVTISKRRGQETFNICHLTDFDIYTPTHRQQTRRIRPPKKICFAVKSQQKSNMFLNGANFVHFFATNDLVLAREWFKAVQGWRSWYLVNILGEGQKSNRASITRGPIRPAASRSQRRASIDAPPYQHGSSRPLLSFDHHDDPNVSNAAPRATKSADVFQARKMPSRDRAPPPSAFPNKLGRDAEPGGPTTNHNRLPSIIRGPAPEKGEISTFAPTGLLGRTYSQRQRAQRDQEISGGRVNSMASVEPPIGLTRKTSTRSVRQMPKPLIDLTPQFQEPPQHVRKGKAVIPEPGQQLVDVATGLDLPPGAIMTPSATTWRRPQAQSPPHENLDRRRGRSMDTGKRRMSIDGSRPRPSMDAGRPQANDDDAFTQGGLLARTPSKRTQGGNWTGHGVRTGDRNGKDKPMIELQFQSQFADGSLLRRVEAHTEKRQEEGVRVGEGV